MQTIIRLIGDSKEWKVEQDLDAASEALRTALENQMLAEFTYMHPVGEQRRLLVNPANVLYVNAIAAKGGTRAHSG